MAKGELLRDAKKAHDRSNVVNLHYVKSRNNLTRVEAVVGAADVTVEEKPYGVPSGTLYFTHCTPDLLAPIWLADFWQLRNFLRS
jgi:hypothetical protein